MVRIAGVNLANNKRVEIALTYIFGIGNSKAKKILTDLKIDFNTKIKDLTEGDVAKLRDVIEKTERVEGDLRREVLANIKRLKEIKAYRGSRHAKGLPVHGQRTKTNTRTVRGNVRRTMGSGKVSIQKT